MQEMKHLMMKRTVSTTVSTLAPTKRAVVPPSDAVKIRQNL